MVFTAPKVKATLEPNPKMFPENNATNTNFTRANNAQLFSSRCKPCGDGDSGFPNCRVICMRKVTCIVQKNSGVRKIVYDGLSKARVGALRYWTVWMDEPILS